MSHNPEQVQMVWPDGGPGPNLDKSLPQDIQLRTFQPGDEARFFGLMASVGWTDWDEARLNPWLHRILPEGWFMLVDNTSGEMIGSCMATHDHTWQVPFCGEVGWTVVHPDHQGRGLGKVVIGAVVHRFLKAGYRIIHLYTENWRHAAIKAYLQMGFIPYLDPPDTIKRWREICEQIRWEFEPSKWMRTIR
jgi:mycothiol synthase